MEFHLLHISSLKKHVRDAVNHIQVGDVLVTCSESARNLGVIFDQHLTLNKHVNNICRNASLALYKIGKIRNLLDQHTTEILIHAFVSSLLDTCNSLLVGMPKKQIDKLQQIQNSAARLVSLLPKREHITPILKQLHWLPVSQRIHYKIIYFTFKAIQQTSPTYLNELIKQYAPTRPLRSASQNLITPVTTRTQSFGARMFSAAAPQLWNSLPNSMRSICKTEHFQSQLKTHLYQIAYK